MSENHFVTIVKRPLSDIFRQKLTIYAPMIEDILMILVKTVNPSTETINIYHAIIVIINIYCSIVL